MPSNPTEQSIQDSIEETGGIPDVEMELEVNGMMQMPVDKSLSLSDMAADAKVTGDAIADINSDLSEIFGWTGENLNVSAEEEKTIAEKFGDVDDALEAIGDTFDHLTGSRIPVSDTDTTTIAAKIDAIDNAITGISRRTGSDLKVSAEDNTSIADKFDSVDQDLEGIGEDLEGIHQWTGENLPVSTEDATTVAVKFGEVDQSLESLAEDVNAIKQWTAEDISISPEDHTSVADALRNTFASTFPVGSIFITVAETLPPTIRSIGTWKQIKVPLTHADMKNGTRSYEDIDETFVAGMMHFWLRIA